MKSKFKVGDVVEAWGVRGIVTNILDVTEVEYPLTVLFENGKDTCFTLTGKFLVWAKKRSLKLIERPKAKKKKVLWVGIQTYPSLDGTCYPTTAAFYSKEQAAIDSNNDLTFVEVEVEVDE